MPKPNKKNAPSILAGMMREQRKRYPKPLTDEEKAIERAKEKGDEVYYDKKTGKKTFLPTKGLEAPDFMIDMLLSGGLAGYAGKLTKKAARRFGTKEAKKLRRNLKAPRGAPDGGELSEKTREVGKGLRSDPAVRQRKQQAQDIRTGLRKEKAATNRLSKTTRATERRETLQDKLESLKRTQRELIEEGKPRRAADYNDDVAEVERMLRRQGSAKRLRAEQRAEAARTPRTPVTKGKRPKSNLRRGIPDINKEVRGMSKFRKEKYGPEWWDRVNKHNDFLDELQQLVKKLQKSPGEPSEKSIKRLEFLDDEVVRLRNSLGRPGMDKARPPNPMRQRRPNRSRPQDK